MNANYVSESFKVSLYLELIDIKWVLQVDIISYGVTGIQVCISLTKDSNVSTIIYSKNIKLICVQETLVYIFRNKVHNAQ